jgi:uncharacterized protein YaeQ
MYETLSLRVAQHPSETAEYLVTRVLAYCLEFSEGLTFSKGGLSDPEEPALSIRDLSGKLTSWIEVGLPEAERLHRAAKASPRVAVYAHRELSAWLARIATQDIHRAELIELYAVDRELISQLTARLARRVRFDFVSTDRHLYLSFDDGTIDGSVTRVHMIQSY